MEVRSPGETGRMARDGLGTGTGRLKWFRCLSCASESCVVSLGLLAVCDGGHISIHGREAVALVAGRLWHRPQGGCGTGSRHPGRQL